jgi:hypothetical protein
LSVGNEMFDYSEATFVFGWQRNSIGAHTTVGQKEGTQLNGMQQTNQCRAGEFRNS